SCSASALPLPVPPPRLLGQDCVFADRFRYSRRSRGAADSLIPSLPAILPYRAPERDIDVSGTIPLFHLPKLVEHILPCSCGLAGSDRWAIPVRLGASLRERKFAAAPHDNDIGSRHRRSEPHKDGSRRVVSCRRVQMR